MEIISQPVQSYLDRMLPAREDVIIEMEQKAEREEFPIIGPHVGMLLEVLARTQGACRVMELGSGYGYSALWFARAIGPTGHLIMTDFDSANRDIALQSLQRLGFEGKSEFLVGDALMILEDRRGPFDIIFNDIDKEFYPETIDPVQRKLRCGGLFITDNSLWHGKVTTEEQDKATRAVVEFNRRLRDDPQFLCLQIPMRDGVAVAVKV